MILLLPVILNGLLMIFGGWDVPIVPGSGVDPVVMTSVDLYHYTNDFVPGYVAYGPNWLQPRLPYPDHQC